jgi:hypothetical protein
MYQLPKELQNLIYCFDNTYKLKFNEILKSITKKYVSEFKYSKKYTHCNHCNIKVQNYDRHYYTTKHQFNLSIQGFVPWYNAIYELVVEYITLSNINGLNAVIKIKKKNDLYTILSKIQLDHYDRDHDIINNYFDPRVIYLLYIYNNN